MGLSKARHFVRNASDRRVSPLFIMWMEWARPKAGWKECKMSLWARSACAGVALAVALSLSRFSWAGDARELGPSREYLIHNVIMKGWILSYNDRGFTFKVDDKPPLDVVVENIPWDALPPTEAERIRRSGAGAADSAAPVQAAKEGISGPTASGEAELIAATRYTLKSGRTVIGKDLPELSTPDTVCIRNKYATQFHIARSDILRAESVMVPETEIFTLAELRERKIGEINPTGGREYMELGNYLKRIGDLVGAKDAFERAMLLDSRFEEAAQRALQEVEEAYKGSVSKYLVEQIRSDIRADRLAEALQKIKKLREIDPDNPDLTTLEAQAPTLERELRKDLRRRVVASYYLKMEELIRERVYNRVPDGPEIPGVVVTTRDGKTFKGMLKTETGEYIEVDVDGRLVRVERSLVAGVSQTNLNTKRRDPTFAESKQYVQDTTGGLAADILKALEEEYKKYGLTQEQIREMWNDRLTDIVIYGKEGAERTPPAYTIHEVNYGRASWLREGAQVVVQPETRQASGAGARRRSKLETDPEAWWKQQPPEVRYQALLAFAAEAQCKVEKVFTTTCNHCGGKGYVSEMSIMAGGGKGAESASKICPTCRGTGKFVGVRYR